MSERNQASAKEKFAITDNIKIQNSQSDPFGESKFEIEQTFDNEDAERKGAYDSKRGLGFVASARSLDPHQISIPTIETNTATAKNLKAPRKKTFMRDSSATILLPSKATRSRMRLESSANSKNDITE